MKTNLKACPFCGESVGDGSELPRHNSPDKCYLVALHLYIENGRQVSPEEVNRLWNRRPVPWVNAAERLPKKEGVIAVIYEEYNGKTRQGDVSYIDRLSYIPEFNMWIRAKGEAIGSYARVTKWMPLPEMPEVHP